MSSLCKPVPPGPFRPIAFAGWPSCNAAMTVPRALEDPELRRFRLRRRRIHAAGGALSMVTPVSSQSLLEGEGIRRFDRDGELPYWADLWPASVAVARALMRGRELAGKNVLDLGCGLGLAGVAAGRRGAEVLFADREPYALRFSLFNAAQNGVRSAGGARLDWHRQTVRGQFDLLCLADVAYEEKSHEPLLRHIGHCLRPGGQALWADPYREPGFLFLERAAARFPMQVLDTDTHFEGRRHPLRLVWFRRA